MGGRGGGLGVGGGDLRVGGSEAWGGVDGRRVAGQASEESVNIAGVGDGEGVELAVVLEREP